MQEKINSIEVCTQKKTFYFLKQRKILDGSFSFKKCLIIYQQHIRKMNVFSVSSIYTVIDCFANFYQRTHECFIQKEVESNIKV